ncbi:MAG TPA: hypothetical protein VK211_12675 [Kamptonema sp.]|nr:hypothetical protein [Kamptonema sp.]
MIDIERLPIEALLGYFSAFLASQAIHYLLPPTALNAVLLGLILRGLLMVGFLLFAVYQKKDSPAALTIISALIFIALWE